MKLNHYYLVPPLLHQQDLNQQAPLITQQALAPLLLQQQVLHQPTLNYKQHNFTHQCDKQHNITHPTMLAPLLEVMGGTGTEDRGPYINPLTGHLSQHTKHIKGELYNLQLHWYE